MQSRVPTLTPDLRSTPTYAAPLPLVAASRRPGSKAARRSSPSGASGNRSHIHTLVAFLPVLASLNIATHVRCICQDKWNRTIVKGISHTRNHCLKIKARVRAKGSRGHNWFHQRQMEWCRGRARVQSLWVLQLAGDFHGTFESGRPTANPHLMRCMLTQNIDVEQRFANGISTFSLSNAFSKLLLLSSPAPALHRLRHSGKAAMLASLRREPGEETQSPPGVPPRTLL